MVFPAGDELRCWVQEIHGGTGPTVMGAAPAAPAAAAAVGVAGERGEGEGEREEPAAALERAGSQARRLLGSVKAALLRWQHRHEHKHKATAAAKGEARRAGLRQSDGGLAFAWGGKPASLLPFVLPDLAEERWVYKGLATLE